MAESVPAAVVVGIGRGIASVLPRGTLAGAAVADGSETLALVVLPLGVLAPAALLQIPWLRLRLLADSLLVASLVLAAVQFINPTSGGMLALQAVLVLLLAATAATTTFRQFRLVPAGARQPLVVQGSLLIALLVALVGRAMAPAFDNPFGQLTVVGFALLVLAGAASSLPPKHQSIISRGRALSVLPYLGTALAVCGVAARIATGHPVATVADVFFPILLWLLVLARHAVSVGEDSYLSGELRRSEEHFRTLVQDSSDVVLLLTTT